MAGTFGFDPERDRKRLGGLVDAAASMPGIGAGVKAAQAAYDATQKVAQNPGGALRHSFGNAVKNIARTSPAFAFVDTGDGQPNGQMTKRQMMNADVMRDWDRRLQGQEQERARAQNGLQRFGMRLRQVPGNVYNAAVTTPAALAMNNVTGPAVDAAGEVWKGFVGDTGTQQPASTATPQPQQVAPQQTAGNAPATAASGAARPEQGGTGQTEQPRPGWQKTRTSGVESRQVDGGMEYQMRMPDGSYATAYKAANQQPAASADMATAPVRQPGLGYNRNGYSFQGSAADAARFFNPIITGPDANNLSGPTNETFKLYRARELARLNEPQYVTPREYGWGWKGYNEGVTRQLQNRAEQGRLANQAEQNAIQARLGYAREQRAALADQDKSQREWAALGARQQADQLDAMTRQFDLEGKLQERDILQNIANETDPEKRKLMQEQLRLIRGEGVKEGGRNNIQKVTDEMGREQLVRVNDDGTYTVLRQNAEAAGEPESAAALPAGVTAEQIRDMPAGRWKEWAKEHPEQAQALARYRQAP